jgi:hypothetical protein
MVVSGGPGGPGMGGAISAYGNSLAITNSTVYNAKAKAGPGGSGGAAPNSSTKMKLGPQGSKGTGQGGGIAVGSGMANLTNNTLKKGHATDKGGDIFQSGGTSKVNNTILGSNHGGAIVKTAGSLTGGHNLISDPTAPIAGLTNTIHASDKLGDLADNGGPTQTLAVLAGSPAIAAADPSVLPPGVTSDQRETITFTGTLTSGSKSVMASSSTKGLATGMPVTAPASRPGRRLQASAPPRSPARCRPHRQW